MHDLDQIAKALGEADLDPEQFERCAQDLLSEMYPGISPVPGGTDWGRDADIHLDPDRIPARLMATKSRKYPAIRSNMLKGLESMRKHGTPFDRVVLANPGILNETQRSRLRKAAAEHGASLDAVYDRGFFASRLRRDGAWRKRLLGLSSELITVSRVPWRLAESPWFGLPLIGRDPELKLLEGTKNDVLLVGRPGVGKTRLLSELSDVLFVDPDASEDRLADDLRWLKPSTVVIDDVGQAPSLVRFVQRLRRQEGDWLRLRLVAACWPHESESISDLIPNGDEIVLELLERPEINAIVTSMGISGVLARQEILDQSEGRPGWAVALADLLLRSGWTDLLTGKALRGQVESYLRRSGLGEHARDLLATVAALRGADDNDLADLADYASVTRADVGRHLRNASRGGLLDVELRRSRTSIRLYTVRPPMLADAIAAEHFFADVPLGDVTQLIERWPARRLQIARTVCAAAYLGSGFARQLVDRLVEETLQQGLSAEDRASLLERYLVIDDRAGSRVARIIREDLDALIDNKSKHRATRQVVELGYLVAARYQNREAVELLIHAALYDHRETAQNPDHPLRKLGELCDRVHPDIGLSSIDARKLVADVVNEWLPKSPHLKEWRVWVEVVGRVLTPHARGGYAAPEDVRRFHFIETIVGPDQAKELYEGVWPQVLARLVTAPGDAVAIVLDAIEDWLRVGGGYDRPFGQDHPEARVSTARDLGSRMLKELSDAGDHSLGLIARMKEMASMFNIELPQSFVSRVESPFFQNVDRLGDWQTELNLLERDVLAEITSWLANDDPDLVVRRLIELRRELEIAGLLWPDRVGMVCKMIAARVDDVSPWVQLARDHGLFPEGQPFVDKAVTDGQKSSRDQLLACLDHPLARRLALGSILAASQDDDLVGEAVRRTEVEDFGLLEMLDIRDELSLEVRGRLLRESKPVVRGCFAVVLSSRKGNPQDNVPPELVDNWRDAVTEIRPALLDRTAGYQFERLVNYLTTHEPDLLEELFRRTLNEAVSSGSSMYAALGHDARRLVKRLPTRSKASLFKKFSETPVRRPLLSHLMGPDIEWLTAFLEQGLVTPDEALGASGFCEGVPLEQLAQLLIPRGIEPVRVAALAHFGSWMGEESARYERLVDQFAEFALAENPSVAAVGEAGVEMFARAREEALERERLNRIRGYS